MQPTVVRNPGPAAYQPPPKTVVSYVPWTPPPPSTEREITFAATGAREPEQAIPVVPPKSEVATAHARATTAAPSRQRRVRTYAPGPMWAAPRMFGFRPWF
ncbi:MAG: hypothetical protein C5B56_12445 [Proteobacteria bacterium]|nr:MAG: hypothetical protein C5B56_12445 [Pseudomonadota bacterium]